MLSALSSEAEMAQAVGAEKGERVEGCLSYLLFQAVFGFAEKPFVVVQDIAPPDQIIDEATTTANGPTAHGTFTLARPGDGRAPGDYGVESYLDAELVEAMKLKIVK